MRQLRLTNTITNRDSESVDRYLHEIGKSELLTNQQEAELAVRIREGDADALDALVKANLRFVVSVAKQYQGQGLSLNDLINEGNLGLIRAAQKFDETKGFKFISYAVWWIRQSMTQAIIEQSKIIRIPTGKAQNYSRISRAFQTLEQEYQRDPSVEDVAQKVGMTENDVNDFLKNIVRTVSTDMHLGKEGEMSVAETLTDPDDLTPEDSLMKTSVESMLMNLVNNLTDREKMVVKLYFGLEGEEAHTLEEIGQKLDLTRERVRQIKEKCIDQLKKRSTVSLLEAYPIR